LEPRISDYIGLKTRCQADHRATEEQINAVRWPTGIRTEPPRGGQPRPRVAVALTMQATTRLSTAFEAPTRDREPHLRHISFCFSSFAVRSPAVPKQQRRESAIVVEGTSSRLATPSPPQHSTATPATRCVHPCSLTVLGKPQRRAQARQSPTANPVVVATPPQSTSRYAS